MHSTLRKIETQHCFPNFPKSLSHFWRPGRARVTGTDTLPLHYFGLRHIIERSRYVLSPVWAPPWCTCTWLMSSQKAWRVCNEAFLMEKCIVDKSILLPKQSFIKAVFWLFTIKCGSTQISWRLASCNLCSSQLPSSYSHCHSLPMNSPISFTADAYC